MVYVYYHIYAIDGVESIIDEQLSLIESNFSFPFILNIGISIPTENISNLNLLKKILPIYIHCFQHITINIIQI